MLNRQYYKKESEIGKIQEAENDGKNILICRNEKRDGESVQRVGTTAEA